MIVKVCVEYNIEEQRIKDLLCAAFEGGSNYWYFIKTYITPTFKTNLLDEVSEKIGMNIEYPYLDLPLMGSGYGIIITDIEEHKDEGKLLDKDACITGLELMAKLFPKDFADFINENEDANTGDIFLQLALYDEVVFG